MTNSRTFFVTLIKKIHFIFMLTLVACNGSSLQMSDGLGGTGVTMGRVTAFGSLYVNGIKFNTDNATFTRNGISSKQQNDFSRGEIVKIIGTVDADRVAGTATEVIYANVIEGGVTALAIENSIEILGQTVTTDQLTVFHGFNSLAELQLANRVEVSGFVTKTGIIATSIKLIIDSLSPSDFSKVEGYISDLDQSAQTFKLHGLTINYATAEFKELTATTLANGLYLIISTQQKIHNNTLQASFIEPFNNQLEAGVSYEIEGYVTEPNSLANFAISLNTASTPVEDSGTSIDSVVAVNNVLIPDSHIIVRGTVNTENVLVVEEIKTLNNDLEALANPTEGDGIW